MSKPKRRMTMTVRNFEEAAKALTARGTRVFFDAMSLNQGQVELVRGHNEQYDLIVWDGFGRAYVNADGSVKKEKLLGEDSKVMLGKLYELERNEKLDIHIE